MGLPAYDFVIVGAGPAGCVLAERLSADPHTRVLLLEAGSARTSRFARLLARLSGREPLRWPYETVPQAQLEGRRLYFPQGRALGGGSATNAMTYVRGRAADYDEWAAAGNPGWDSAAVLAGFQALERSHAATGADCGRNGLLDVSDPVDPHPLTAVFLEAAAELGFPVLRDFTGAEQEAAGVYRLTQRNGRRRSAADAFLRPARSRPNLTVLTGREVVRIGIAARRAAWVELLPRGGGHLECVELARELIVSAGAIHSPRLLLLSGIGPADELTALGIPVQHDLPGVGRNLQDHLNVPVIARCDRAITYDHWDRPLRFLRSGLQYALFNSGVATSNLCEGGAFLRSGAAGPPDIQLHFLPLMWLDAGRARLNGYGMTLEAALLCPQSRGTVTLASSDPLAAPRINPRYCSAPGDLEALVQAVRRCRELFHTEAFRPYLAGDLLPASGKTSDADLAGHIRAYGVTSYHPAGTCRMGGDALAVVDAALRVRGLTGLRVIDSSIMPWITRGSTQAPSLMIGELGARRILADPR